LGLVNDKDIPLPPVNKVLLVSNSIKKTKYRGYKFYKIVDGITASIRVSITVFSMRRRNGSYTAKGLEFFNKTNQYSVWVSYTFSTK
jgi:hypothetical protein